MRIQLIAKQKEIRECQLLKIEVRDPTTWTILQKYGPNHLGSQYNVLPAHLNGPNHLGFCALQVAGPG